MRIEKITKENVKELPDVTLRNLKIRFVRIHDQYFRDEAVEKAVNLDRRTFYNKYVILSIEMKRRDIRFQEDSALDKLQEVKTRVFLKSLWGIDVPELNEITIVKSYVAISGAFIRSPKATRGMDVVIRNLEENKDERLEEKITMVLKAHTGRQPNFVYDPAGPQSTYIPVFDLVLRARDATERIQIEKKIVEKKIKIEKGAIPFKDLGVAAENTAWAGAKETVKAEVEDLRQICTWYDSSDPDVKASYKLPHHRMSDKKAVWRAVSAAMAALLGARGGVDIPSADKQGVYNHLANHYKQWDKEAPELKKYSAEELEKAFPIEKPEETENTIRIPVGPDCDVTATITIDKDQGIQALYCGRIKKIRTYLFDKRIKAWTMDSAKAWVKEQTQKMEKKLSDAMQKEYDEETALIRENSKVVKYPHKFKAAKWTWPNGHPRCIHCGEEEMVDKNDNQLPCEKPITKFTITKIDKKKQMVGGIIYEPDEIDTQGDYANSKEIEKAQERFMQKYATDTKRIRINHMGKKLFFPIIECFIPEHDTIKGDKPLKKGAWWLMIKITNEGIWKDIEAGKLTGFSMGGTAKA